MKLLYKGTVDYLSFFFEDLAKFFLLLSIIFKNCLINLTDRKASG
jgi:hypothetical protein